MQLTRFRFFPAIFLVGTSFAAGTTPFVGNKAADFSLTSTRGTTVRLSELTAQGPVIVVVLRGYPGYQCPFCERQVQDFVGKAPVFTEAGFRVVFVYPGPRKDLGRRAGEFLQKTNFPESFHMLLDPDYEFTNLYELRWDAPGETAYPATFLIDRTGAIYFEKIGKVHGGRSTTAEIIGLLPRKKANAGSN